MTGKEQYTIDVTGTNDHSGMSASTADLYETEANHVVWADRMLLHGNVSKTIV